MGNAPGNGRADRAIGYSEVVQIWAIVAARVRPMTARATIDE